jgi:hypothetical protein
MIKDNDNDNEILTIYQERLSDDTRAIMKDMAYNIVDIEHVTDYQRLNDDVKINWSVTINIKDLADYQRLDDLQSAIEPYEEMLLHHGYGKLTIKSDVKNKQIQGIPPDFIGKYNKILEAYGECVKYLLLKYYKSDSFPELNPDKKYVFTKPPAEEGYFIFIDADMMDLLLYHTHEVSPKKNDN